MCTRLATDLGGAKGFGRSLTFATFARVASALENSRFDPRRVIASTASRLSRLAMAFAPLET